MKKICVFSGSNPGSRIEYTETAALLAHELVIRNLGLVYGGADVGLMKVLADTMIKKGGHVTGVIPEFLAKKEIAHPNLTEMHLVSSMQERKVMMETLSSGFIALPGGFGTLDEIFEILTGSQLGFHKKPCGILNVNGFYRNLLSFLKTLVKERFIKEAHRKMLLVANTPAALLDLFESYQAPQVTKWDDRSPTA